MQSTLFAQSIVESTQNKLTNAINPVLPIKTFFAPRIRLGLFYFDEKIVQAYTGGI